MGKLANISGKEAVKAFAKADWKIMGQVGSHVVMTKPESERIFPSRNTKSYLRAHSVR